MRYSSAPRISLTDKVGKLPLSRRAVMKDMQVAQKIACPIATTANKRTRTANIQIAKTLRATIARIHSLCLNHNL